MGCLKIRLNIDGDITIIYFFGLFENFEIISLSCKSENCNPFDIIIKFHKEMYQN